MGDGDRSWHSAVLAAWQQAIVQRQPTDVTHCIDHGCQHGSGASGKRRRAAGVRRRALRTSALESDPELRQQHKRIRAAVPSRNLIASFAAYIQQAELHQKSGPRGQIQ